MTQTDHLMVSRWPTLSLLSSLNLLVKPGYTSALNPVNFSHFRVRKLPPAVSLWDSRFQPSAWKQWGVSTPKAQADLYLTCSWLGDI